MEYSKSSLIITKTFLDDDTGEFKIKDFKEVTESKRLKGGFMLVYKDYDSAVCDVVNSKKDLQVLIAIREMFTYCKVEIGISPTELAKKELISKVKVVTILSKMVEVGLLLRVRKGIYRLNPFMYLPYRSEGDVLQREWNELLNIQKNQSRVESY